MARHYITSRLPARADAGRLAGGLLGAPRAAAPPAALYVDKILRGAKPADLPALGLTIPPSLRLRADRVIE